MWLKNSVDQVTEEKGLSPPMILEQYIKRQVWKSIQYKMTKRQRNFFITIDFGVLKKEVRLEGKRTGKF